MRLKLDENLSRAAAQILREAGHEASTVTEERMAGADDMMLIAHCVEEDRVLVTMDLDFGNTILFPPALYHGIAVLRPRSKPSPEDILACIRVLARFLGKESIVGNLWIVESTRVRIHRLRETDS